MPITAAHLLRRVAVAPRPVIERPEFPDQVELLYRYAGYGLATVLINAALVLGIFREIISMEILGSWFALNVSAGAGAYALILGYRRVEEPRPEVWWTLFGVGAVLIGTLWGTTGAVLYATDAQTYHIIMLLLIASMAVGAIPFLSTAPGTYYAFALPALLPFAASLLGHGGQVSVVLACVVLLCTGLLGTASRQVLSMVTEGISARRAEERLLRQLAEAKGELEQENEFRREVQRLLMTERARLDVTLSSITEAVIATNGQGQIEYMNPAARALMGDDARSAYGRPLVQVLGLGEADRRRVQVTLAEVRNGSQSEARLHGLKLTTAGERPMTVNLAVGAVTRPDEERGLVLAVHEAPPCAETAQAGG